MKKDAYKNLSKFSNNQTAFSLALLRDGILNDILDDDANDILYYAGKEVARQFYTKTLNGIQEFFQQPDGEIFRFLLKRKTKKAGF